jgi:MoxR-like ATPase
MARNSNPKPGKSEKASKDAEPSPSGGASSGTDWRSLEAGLDELSSGATSERFERPAPEELTKRLAEAQSDGVDPRFVKEWTDLGFKPIEARQEELKLSSEHLALRHLQEEDGIKGLSARSHYSVVVSRLNQLGEDILKDKDLAPKTRENLLAEVRAGYKAASEAYNTALLASPEAFLAAHSADLNKYARQAERGRIIETPYVLQKEQEIIDHLLTSRMVFLSGETGTGKTEVARICAKKATGHEALVVRGYAGMSKTELYGHMTLTDSSEKRAENARQMIQQAEATYLEKFPDASKEDLAKLTREILSGNGVTTTEYILGAVYEAARDGKVVIIDEANYIPPELLASLNDIMTKTKREKISVQQDGVDDIPVKEGFGIIFTGNLNPPTGPLAKRYVGRKEFDAAFTDRVPEVKYDRLPQAVDGKPKDFSFEDKQLFVLAVISALNYIPKGGLEFGTLEKLESRYGSLYLPGGAKDGLDLLWRFSQFVAVTQKAFHGEIKTGDSNGFQRDGNNVGKVPKVQLSNRGMMRVIEQWRNDGFQYELDYYIARDLFSRAKDPTDRAYLYQMGQKFGFFKSNGWNQKPDYSSEGVQSFEVKIPTQKVGANYKERGNDAAPSGIVPARQVISALWGEIPARKVWPDGERAVTEKRQGMAAQFAAISAQLDDLFEPLKDELAALEEVAQFDRDHDQYMESIKKPLERLAEG